MSARLLFRVDPLSGESPRGYLCRVAQEHGYPSPSSVVQIAGLPPAGLDREDHIEQLAHALRLEPEEWRTLCYRSLQRRDRSAQRLFCGEPVSADDLNYGHPRLCPLCLRERPIWWAAWDLALVTVCPLHHRRMVNRCPGCQRKVSWRRPAVHRCHCGFDFRTIAPEEADGDLVSLHAAIWQAARVPFDHAAPRAVANYGFPPHLLDLKLGPLLRLILFVGSIQENGTLRRKQPPFAATDLPAAAKIGRAAAALLRNWPQPFREVLRCIVPPTAENPVALHFSEVFGNFYRHLFRILPRQEVGFLHEVFEQFVIEEWKGLIRGQHRYFSAAVRQNSAWVTANEAERLARTAGGRILDLVRQGHLESILFSVRPGGRTEYWIRRASLDRWMADREAELALYLPRPKAQCVLGLTNHTIVKVAAAGALRYVAGPEQNFPAGRFFFLREDVMKIQCAFEKHAVPVKQYSKPGEVIALRHAMKNYLGRDSGLAAVIRAVIVGDLLPVGYARQFRGITGYLFRSEDLRRYRPVPESKTSSEGFLNYREAAAILEVNRLTIRGLVLKSMLGGPVESQSGLSKLLPAAEVQRFAEDYVPISVLAKRFHLNSVPLARYLRESGTPLLAIPLPETGKGQALFLRKDVAAQIRFPSEDAAGGGPAPPQDPAAEALARVSIGQEGRLG